MNEKTNSETCETCRFFRRKFEGSLGGECRRYAPGLRHSTTEITGSPFYSDQKMSHSTSTAFPKMECSGWCGDWKPLEDEEKPAEVSNIEDQKTISNWADETFGPSGSNARVAARANEEMAELLRALTADDNHPKAAEEVADIVIILYRLATRLGIDLHDEIDQKMSVNRAREWKLDKTGHGYHVRSKAST